MEKKIAVMIVICGILSLIEVYYNELLEENSSYFIKWIQKADSGFLRSVFYYLDHITSTCFLIISGCIYLIYNRDDGILCITAAYSGAALSGILKSLFAHPRPLWKYEDIEAITCPKDWGSPSGHSMAAGTPLIMMLILLYNRNAKQSYKLTVIVFIVITAMTRLYIGAHFYFQVVLGFSFSCLIALVIFSLSQKGILRYLDWNFFVKSQVFFLFCILASLMVNKYQEPTWNKYWEENFKDKCKGSITNEKAQNKALLDSLLWANVSGLFIGRFLLGKQEVNRKWKLFPLVFMASCVYGSIYVEKVLTNELLNIVLVRYLTGFMISWTIPKVLSVFRDMPGSV